MKSYIYFFTFSLLLLLVFSSLLSAADSVPYNNTGLITLYRSLPLFLMALFYRTQHLSLLSTFAMLSQFLLSRPINKHAQNKGTQNFIKKVLRQFRYWNRGRVKKVSVTKLGSELDEIKQLLIENGYPVDVLLSCINQKVANFAAEKTFGQEKCPVYLKLPWIGNVSSKFENQINKAITSCFYAVKPRVVYSTRAMLPSAKKDSVPTTQKSCVVYEFSCRCEARYVGRTTQRLADRIKQHVPTSIRKKSNTVREQPPRLCKNNNSKINCESAIGQHLLTNPECAKTYTDDNFRIIGQGRSSFHLSVLESVYIKTQNPDLCKQKDFIFSLGIFK